MTVENSDRDDSAARQPAQAEQKRVSTVWGVEELLRKSINKNRISFEVEKMIRAYDPCMSCASHFLKLKIIRKVSR